MSPLQSWIVCVCGCWLTCTVDGNISGLRHFVIPTRQPDDPAMHEGLGGVRFDNGAFPDVIFDDGTLADVRFDDGTLADVPRVDTGDLGADNAADISAVSSADEQQANANDATFHKRVLDRPRSDVGNPASDDSYNDVLEDPCADINFVQRKSCRVQTSTSCSVSCAVCRHQLRAA